MPDHAAPHTAATQWAYTARRNNQEWSKGFGHTVELADNLVKALVEERVLERLTAAEAVCEAYKTLHDESTLQPKSSPWYAARDVFDAALVAYDAAQQSGKEATRGEHA